MRKGKGQPYLDRTVGARSGQGVGPGRVPGEPKNTAPVRHKATHRYIWTAAVVESNLGSEGWVGFKTVVDGDVGVVPGWQGERWQGGSEW